MNKHALFACTAAAVTFKGEGVNVPHVQEGKSVVVNGQCQGMNGAEVVLDECTLQSVTALPLPRSRPHAHQHHRMVYKIGEYPRRPDWMSQKQWDAYIHWEAKQMGW